MLRDEIQGLQKATPRDLRKFGLVVGGVFLLLGLVFWVPKWHRDWCWWFLIPGGPLVLLGGVRPRSLKWVYVGWMTLAMMLGAVVSTILLTLLFYVMVVPLGLLARVVGKDFLSQKVAPAASSYWIRRDTSKPKEKHRHEQQF